jgi:hypothetical protein
MILKRLMFERKSPTGWYGDDLWCGAGFGRASMRVASSPLLWPLVAPLAGVSSIEGHMFACVCGMGRKKVSGE